ncbi:phosphatase PAP2 family protein [Neobacillus sp. D3-1R]|uniref:phosphatase PAP2 family protein n=1 Tax=Neobacillus sp. D3-1R TaxID=3445778 RepID=UPI003F9FC6F5
MNKKYEKHFFIYSLVAGLIGIYLLYLVTHSESLWIDRTFSAIFTTSNSTAITIFDYITQLGYKLGIGTVALLTILWLWIKKKDYAGMATIALAVGLGNEVNKLLKNWIGRERPSLEHIGEEASLSFPSGHAMVGIILYMLLAYFLVKYIPSTVGKWIAAASCVVIILLLGISRLVLNVHYASDVIAGYAFGFIWAFLWILIYQQIKEKAKVRG